MEWEDARKLVLHLESISLGINNLNVTLREFLTVAKEKKQKPIEVKDAVTKR